MAEPATATPAPAPTEAPAPAPEPAEATLATVLAELKAPEPEPESAESAPEATPEAEPAKPAPDAPKVDLFTDQALSTPEGMKRAKAEVLALRAKHESAYHRVTQREAKFAKSVEAFKGEKAEVQTLGNNLRAALGALRRGTTDQRIEALGQLTGQDGLKVFEQLTLDLARGGKKSEPTPEVQELRAELAELKGYIQRSQADHEIKTRENFISRRKAEIAEAAGDAKLYPYLARLAPSRGREIADQIAEMMTEAHVAGKPISDAEALQALELEIARVTGPLASGPDLAIGATPNGGQKPDKARSTPGRSISPSLTTKVSSVREMTESERLEDLGKDTDYLRGLGLPI